MYALISFFLICCAVATLPQNEVELLGPELAGHYHYLQAQLRTPSLPDAAGSASATPSPLAHAPGAREVARPRRLRRMSADVPAMQHPERDGLGEDPKEAGAARVVTKSSQHKPRMLNARKPQRSKMEMQRPVVEQALPRGAFKSPQKTLQRAARKVEPTVQVVHVKKKWDSFRALVKGWKHLQTAEFQHGAIKIRGLSAVNAMKAGTEVLRVPANLVLSKANPALQNFYAGLDFEEPSDPSWKLVCFLAVQQRLGDQSPWAPYLAHLPKLSDFKAFHPLWASEDLLHLFAPLPLLHDVREYRRRARTEWRQWKDFSAVLEDSVADSSKSDEQIETMRKVALDVTEEDIQWAFTVVLTRGFSTPQGSALAPVADDLNTDSPFNLNVQWHGQQDGSVQLVTTASASQGDELLTSYSAGTRNNDEFAASFGFALTNNVDVVARLPPKDCDDMAKNLKSKYGFKDPERSGKCIAPASERQPVVFCTLLQLAKEHCPATKFD